jgi:folate-dependent phosphoribosylglycinamide formyltransferase PurN
MDNIRRDEIKKKIIFLSSSYVNLAKFFASENKEYDVFLIIDRKLPFEIEDLDNFYTFNFDYNKLFERDRSKYFDNLSLFINKFEPDLIVTNNYTKLLPKSFIDFFKFTKNLDIINIHHADLRIKDDNGDMRYKGLTGDIKQFLDEGMFISTIHKIENEKIDEGEKLAFSHETTFKELKQKGIFSKKEDIFNLRRKNLAISYHERTKVLNPLKKVVSNLINNN